MDYYSTPFRSKGYFGWQPSPLYSFFVNKYLIVTNFIIKLIIQLNKMITIIFKNYRMELSRYYSFW